MSILVSVVMAVYNGEKYLKQAIESILNQTYKNIEFIIVNDGSTDISLKIINEYRKVDKRIKIINNVENRGLIYSLNKGIEKSSGKYIARMDADDIAIRSRLEEQVNFMEKNKDIALSGSADIIFFEGKEFVKVKTNVVVEYELIKAKSLFESPFVHPSVIIRKDVIEENNFRYKEIYKHAEDFGLWTEIISKYKVSNIDKPLLKYRIVKDSITRAANKNMIQREVVFKEIYNSYLKSFNINLSQEELDMHFEIAMIQNIDNSRFTLYSKMEYLNRLIEKIDCEYVKRVCAEQYLKNCIYQGSYKDFADSDLSRLLPINKFKFYKRYYLEILKKIIKKSYK